MFVSPTWKLLASKKREFDGLDGIVLNKLLEDAYVEFNYRGKWNNYIIDECSMITEEQKRRLMKIVDGKIIFCGDLGYQLPPVDGVEMNTEGIDNIVKLTKNYRVKCDKLLEILNNLRDAINGEELDKSFINAVKDTDIDYKKEDIILCHTNKQKDIYTERYKHIEKYKVLSNGRYYHNNDIVFNKISGVNTVLQHGFTIHCVQGTTFEKKIFINIRCMNKRLLYTAMSRARYLSQIVLMK